MSVTLALLAAHLLGDFPLQPTRMAVEKFESVRVRVDHVIVHGALTYVLLVPLVELGVAATAGVSVSVVHFVVDSRRWVDADAGGFDGYAMAVDQSLHVAGLYVVSVVVLS